MSERMPTTRMSLIDKLADLDCSNAWYDFALTYRPAIYRLARRGGLQASAAEDLAQEVLIAAADKIPQWDSERGSLRAWLLVVTRNRLINALTRRPRDQSLGGDNEALGQLPSKATESATIDWEFRRAQFRQAVGRVEQESSSTAWECFRRTTLEKQTASDIARELNISIGAVYTNKSRVLKRLRVLARGNDAPS